MFEFLTAMLLKIQAYLDLTLHGYERMTLLTTLALRRCQFGEEWFLVQILIVPFVICIQVACVSVSLSERLFYCTITKSSEAVEDLTQNSMCM
jgi:hypothetical protein